VIIDPSGDVTIVRIARSLAENGKLFVHLQVRMPAQ
jgi:hypothetical protein